MPYIRGMEKPNAPHAVLTTQIFEQDVRAAGLSDDEVTEIVVFLSENPTAGDVMAGTGGARKVRFAGRGKGKSGGYRTIHYYAGTSVPIFLLALVDKRKEANLSKAERNELRAILSTIADDYRAMVAQRVIRLRRVR